MSLRGILNAVAISLPLLDYHVAFAPHNDESGFDHDNIQSTVQLYNLTDFSSIFACLGGRYKERATLRLLFSSYLVFADFTVDQPE